MNNPKISVIIPVYNGGKYINQCLDSLLNQTFKDFEILSYKKIGNIATIIMEDNKNVRNKLSKMNPVILDYLPLTLEEIFIYKMEVLGYEFKEIN